MTFENLSKMSQFGSETMPITDMGIIVSRMLIAWNSSLAKEEDLFPLEILVSKIAVVLEGNTLHVHNDIG